MHPYLLGHRAYPTFIALGIVVGVLVGWMLARRAPRPLGAGRVLLVAALLGTAFLVGARVHDLVAAGELGQAGGQALWQATYRYPGGLVAVGVTLPVVWWTLLREYPLGRVADTTAVALAFGTAVGRIGCFLAGCCFGVVSALPWAVSFPPNSPAWSQHVAAGLISPAATESLAVHPLELYFALLALGVGLYLWWIEQRRAFDGHVALLFLVLHESGKAALELLRSPELTQPTWHLRFVSMALAGMGLMGLMAGHLRRRARVVRAAGEPVRGLGPLGSP